MTIRDFDWGTPQPLTRDRLADQVVRNILQLIVSGSLSAGEFLPPEHHLASRFGVSRAVVREAMTQLVSKGLLNIRQGIGTTVTSSTSWNWLDPDILLHANSETTFGHLMQVRYIFEPEVAALAAMKRSDQHVQTLMDALEKCIHSGSLEDFAHWDMTFHHALAEAAGNPLLLVIENSISKLLSASRAALHRVPGSGDRANQCHRAILEAVRANDGDGSRRAMLDHLEQTSSEFTRLKAMLESIGEKGVRNG